ncbi:MAG: pyridoxamine 5'-phosphate oxidase [Acidimicrobiales bacterium]
MYLDDAELPPEPLSLFRSWYDDVRAAELPEPDAVVLATAGVDGRSVARFVLLRGLDERGFVWFTNRRSRKGRQLAENPWGCLTFPWYPLYRQVIVSGPVDVVDDTESDAYWANRPRGSQLAARVSDQSDPLPDRATLEDRFLAEERRFEDEPVPRPSHWGGYRLAHQSVEFWHSRPNRLHDRVVYERDGSGGWRITRLYP